MDDVLVFVNDGELAFVDEELVAGGQGESVQGLVGAAEVAVLGPDAEDVVVELAVFFGPGDGAGQVRHEA